MLDVLLGSIKLKRKMREHEKDQYETESDYD